MTDDDQSCMGVSLDILRSGMRGGGSSPCDLDAKLLDIIYTWYEEARYRDHRLTPGEVESDSSLNGMEQKIVGHSASRLLEINGAEGSGRTGKRGNAYLISDPIWYRIIGCRRRAFSLQLPP